MSLFDQLLVKSLPLVPRPLVGRISRSYIAGESLQDTVRCVRELNAEGAVATVDVLGEDTTEREQARATAEEYLRVVDAIVSNDLDCNISVKLTAFGLLIDPSFCADNLRRVVEAARRHDMFVRIDMEDSGVTTRTLDLYREMRDEYPRVGPVLQAYMRRSMRDADELLADAERRGDGGPLNVRLCKGIYNEPPAVAFKDRDVVRRSYAHLLERFLRGGAYVGIATHDAPLLYEGLRLVHELGLSRDRYEFQMLLGVIPEVRRILLEEGHRLRVYVPYGANWYGYSVRRLKENPKVAGYVFKDVVRRVLGR